MRFALRISALMLVAAAAIPQPAQAMSQPPAQMAVKAAPAHQIASDSAKVPLTLSVVTIAGFALMGTTRDLDRTYLFNGMRYGPGKGIEVPDDFPELDDSGDVIHPKGSAAERNQKRARMFSSPPSTGGVNTGVSQESGASGSSNTVSGKSEKELQSMKVDDLQALADESGIEVVRGDGEDGEPLKADYVRALSEPTA